MHRGTDVHGMDMTEGNQERTMKEIVKIKKWQLLRYRSAAIHADLTASDFVTVGKRAFFKSRAESLTLPGGTSAIKAEAFLGCDRLKTVTLPVGNNVGLSFGVFRGCSRLQTLENSDMLAAIGESAFENCMILREITLGNSLHRIGDHAFRSCRSLTSVELPFGLEKIGEGAFRDCTELETVEADALRVASKDLFRGCISLKAAPIPTSWEEICNGTFRDCTSFSAVHIPGRIRRIGARAFQGCTRLSELTVELGVEELGAFAFADVPALREVLIPHSIKKLGWGAFGLGKRKNEEKIRLLVENDYMARRLKRMLFLCGSSGCATVSVIGKTIEERKRERRRSNLNSEPVHLVDFDKES